MRRTKRAGSMQHRLGRAAAASCNLEGEPPPLELRLASKADTHSAAKENIPYSTASAFLPPLFFAARAQ